MVLLYQCPLVFLCSSSSWPRAQKKEDPLAATKEPSEPNSLPPLNHCEMEREANKICSFLASPGFSCQPLAALHWRVPPCVCF